jgi:hypothetical protein
LEEALAISRKLGFQEEIAAALLMRQEPRQAVSTLAATDRRLQHPAQARREPPRGRGRPGASPGPAARQLIPGAVASG